MSKFGWDLPPGVSPNDPHIAGYPPCASCGHPEEDHYDEETREDEEGNDYFRGAHCESCFAMGFDDVCLEYQQYADIPDVPPDPDEKYDRAREEYL